VPAIVYDPSFAGEWELDKAVTKPGLANLTATLLTLLGFQPPADYLPSIVKLKG
jgi:2,3-bisphosphoglycerate-independent phosphoglycerate mutase